LAPFSYEQVEKRVTELSSLSTLPTTLKRITKLTESKDTSAADVAELIGTDQVLASKVLRVVNSPVYGFPGRISNITHAVVLLGFSVIKGMVLATAVFNSIGKQGKGLWEHSLECALMSRRIAKECNLPEVEEVMIAGLLHDLGKVVLSFLYPKSYNEAVEWAASHQTHIAKAETEVIGVDHPRVNRMLAQEWHFPERLSEPMIYHHLPSRAKTHQDVTDIVHLANILSRAMGYGFPCDYAMPELDHTAFHRLNLSFEQLDKILQDTELEFESGSGIFLDME